MPSDIERRLIACERELDELKRVADQLLQIAQALQQQVLRLSAAPNQ